MYIKMLETRRGSPDAFSIALYKVDREYDLPDTLARHFISKGYARETSIMEDMENIKNLLEKFND